MRFLKSAFIYIGASLINKAFPFLMLPVLTRYLEPSEFGAVSLFLVINSCIGAIVGMNVSANVSKSFFFLSREKLAVLIGNMFVLIAVLSAFVLFSIFLFTFFFVDAFSISAKYLYATPVLSFMMMVNTINLTILRNEDRPYVFGLFEISCTFLVFGITLVLLVFYDFGWQSQIVGLLVSYGIFFFVALIYMRKRGYLVFHPSAEGVSSVFKSSYPMIPYVLSGIAINAADRVFIEQMLGLDSLGLYSIGYSFGIVVMLFSDAFNKAWNPWFYKQMVSPSHDVKKKIVKYTYTYIAFLFLLAGCVSIVGSFVLPYVVSEKFHAASEFIFWVSLAFAVQGVYRMFFPYFILADRASEVASVLISAAVCGLVANYFFIEAFGAIGAAFAMIVAWGVSVILAVMFQMRSFEMPWGLGDEKVADAQS